MNDVATSELFVVATPIGNLGDLSTRAIQTLSEAEFWIVEDTRVSGKLASHLGLKKPMRILNDHTSPQAVSKLLSELKTVQKVALLTDGGTPVISDPGTGLLDLCYSEGIKIIGIPGPSAPTLALSISGFYGQRYVFLGFLGRKAGDIRRELIPFAESPMTILLFESVHRYESLLKVAGETLGSRRYAICRELTKAHEQIYRSRLPDIPSAQILPHLGELTIVLEGHRRQTPT